MECNESLYKQRKNTYHMEHGLFSGFDAYLGFLHTENYQINPTVHTFIALLQLKTPKYTIQPEHTQTSEGSAEDLEKGEKIKLGKY